MKKQMLKNILILLLVTVLMGGLIGGAYAITAPIIKRNENRVLENAAKESFEGSDVFFKIRDELAKEVLGADKVEALTKEELKELDGILFVFKGEEFQGVIVVTTGKNGHGEVTLGVAITSEDLIAGLTTIKYEQTPGIGDAPRDKYLEEFKDKEFGFELDPVAGATNSSKLLAELVKAATDKYEASKPTLEKVVVLAKDPVEEVFGEYTVSTDLNFKPNEVVTKKQQIKGTKTGYVYTGIKSHSFDTGFSEVSGSIELKLYAFDDGEIALYTFTKYEHTEAGYQDKLVKFLDKLVGTNIADLTTNIAEHQTLLGGASESGVNTLVPILREIEKANLPLEAKLYGIDFKKTSTGMEAYQTVVAQDEITGSITNGSSFTVEITSTIDTGFQEVSGKIKIEVFVDTDQKILGYQYLEYGHTLDYKRKIDNFLDAFIGTNLNEISATIAAEKAKYAGSTETAEKAIVIMLKDIESLVSR